MTDLTIEDIKTGNVVCSNGWGARILATNLKGPYPVCFLATCKENNEQVVLRATATGRYSDTDDKPHAFDLVLIVKPHYFNIYTGLNGSKHTGCIFNSIAVAKDQAYKCESDFYETFQYLDGEVTKVEPEGDE